MSTGGPGAAARRAATALAALAGAAAVGYGVQRGLARRLRARPDVGGTAGIEGGPEGESLHLPSHDGGSIHVFSTGTGSPVVLSHGVTLSHRTWVHQLSDLPAQGFRVLAYDHRGHGASQPGDLGHTIAALGDDLRTVVEELDLRHAVLVGHSMGGVAVQSFVIRHPDVVRERVAGIVLLSTIARTPFGRGTEGINRWLDRVAHLVPDTTRLWQARDLGLVLARVGFGRDPSPGQVELVRRMMLECPAETRRDAPRSLIGLDLTDGLRTVEVPTLVVVGSADVLTPPREARRIASLIPGARLVVMEGGGHMLMLERRADFDRLLVGFVRETTRAGTEAV